MYAVDQNRLKFSVYTFNC